MISSVLRGALTALRRLTVTIPAGGSTCQFRRTSATSGPNSSSNPHIDLDARSAAIPGHAPDLQERSSLVKPLSASTSAPGSSITLRPYQHAAIAACLDALSSGLTRIGVSSPTGSGKTTMFMSLIPRVRRGSRSHLVHDGDGDGNESRNGNEDGGGGGGGDGDGTRAAGVADGSAASGEEMGSPFGLVHPEGSLGQTLIVVSSVELASQAEVAAQRLLGESWSIEVEQGKRHASGYADVTIATWQTLNNIERLRKFEPARFKLVIVDEAHHAAALSYLRLLQYFNDGVVIPSVISPITTSLYGNKVPIIGFSATFSRPDQLALSAVFQKIVFHREISTMLEEGWLSPAKSTTVKCDLDLSHVELNAQGDFNASSLASRVNTSQVNDLIVRTYLHRAASRRSTLVFCVDLEHVDALTSAFRRAGIDARSVSSLSIPSVRRDTIAAFSNGQFPVLINCEVLTEGADIPEIDCILLARPTRSRNLLAQMASAPNCALLTQLSPAYCPSQVGRGLRLSPQTGKEDCHIIDIVDAVDRSNGMLVSPTLWGLSHDEAALEQRQERALAAETIPGGNGLADREDPDADAKVTFIDQDDPFRLANKERPPLATLSQNAWVACGGDRYILEALGNGYILVEPSTGQAQWSITYRRKLPQELGKAGKSFYSRVQQVALADELERAIQTGDQFAIRTLGGDLALKLSRYAAWRYRPPSKKALDMMMKMKGVDVAALEQADSNSAAKREVRIFGRAVAIDKLTAGQVSSYLCAANHGAASLRRKEDTAKTRARAKEKMRAEKARVQAERNLPLPPSG